MSLHTILQSPDHAHAYLLVANRAEVLEKEIAQFLAESEAQTRAFTRVLAPVEDKIDVEATRIFRQAFDLQSVAALTIGIIAEVDKMTLPAQQMLLKLLEEAPPRVVFLLTTTKPRVLTRPLLSRVRLIRLASQAIEFTKEWDETLKQLFSPTVLLFDKQQLIEKLVKKQSMDDILYYFSAYLWQSDASPATLQKWFSTLSYVRHATMLRNGLEYFFLT